MCQVQKHNIKYYHFGIYVTENIQGNNHNKLYK